MSPVVTTTYTITALHYSGYQVTAKATIEVIPIPPPTITLVADPDMLAPGASSTLTWASTNATSVTIDNGIGSVDVEREYGRFANSRRLHIGQLPRALAGQPLRWSRFEIFWTMQLQSGMDLRAALAGEDIEAALVYFDDQFKEVFRKQFTDRQGNLAQIVAGMSNLTLADAYEEDARFYITRKERSSIDGLEHDYVYEVIFVKATDGNWKILHF